jgi:protein-S-isoprenylcysteine O-methyltransferase Ste14
MIDETQEAAGMGVPPPLLYGGTLGLSLLLHRFFPRSMLPRNMARVVGGALVGLNFLFGPPAVLAIRRAQPAQSPDEPITTIVDHGPFRYSRNPIYVAFTLVYTGIAIFANTLWALLFLPGVLLLIHRQVVDRGEPYLERVFGAEYLWCKHRVRRWI